METLSQWKIYVGAFFDRFGEEKLNILASDDPIIQAAIKDCSVRQYIDLCGCKAEMQSLLQYMFSKGFNIDVNTILNLVPTQDEIWKGENYVPPTADPEVPVNVMPGTVYKTAYGYTTCRSDELAPDSYEKSWPVSAEFLSMISEGAEITERGDRLCIVGSI